MVILKTINTTVQKMIPRSYHANASEYKLSCFSYACTMDDTHYLVNTFTLEVLLLTSEEYEILTKSSMFTNIEGNPFLRYLREHYFIVDKTIDEVREYHKIKSMLGIYVNKSNILHNYTILPTTVCNARCFYCFEQEMIPETLTDAQVDSLIDMMIKNHKDKPVKIQWFGGEPLCGIHQIRRICNELRSHEIPFESSMVSNGFLFDKKTIQEAVNEWNMKSIQITLDGKEEEYNTRKNYYSTTVSPFFKVLDNVLSLQEAGVFVVIRLNADMDNIDELTDLVDYLDTKFSSKEKVEIYSHPLFGEYNKPSFIELFTRVLELNEYIKQLGFKTSEIVKMNRLKVNYCKANNPGSVVVGADGMLYACEHYDKSQAYGNVRDGITDKKARQDWIHPAKGSEVCQNCVFLPICTDFPYCPDTPSYPICKKMMELSMKKYLTNVSDESDEENLPEEDPCS